MKKILKLGITHGDINGISYEIILKALSDTMILDFCTPIIYGSPKVLSFYKKMFDFSSLNIPTIRTAQDATEGKMYVINTCGDDIKIEPGKQSIESGELALQALEAATKALADGEIDVLVTAPINKSTIQSDRFNFPGHTEYLEQISGAESIMMLTSDNVRVALATNHTPISKISQTLSKELILHKLQMFHKSLVEDFCITCPRIAVMGLNPHASDNGLLGSEEQDIIIPAINEANEQGITATGPLSADGFWGSGAFSRYDGILAMYHDQGLAPFKALFQDTGVNFTAGLPFIRTSPAHGTAYDLAGKNTASPNSLLKAIYMAIDIHRNRLQYAELSANRLQEEKVETVDIPYSNPNAIH